MNISNFLPLVLICFRMVMQSANANSTGLVFKVTKKGDSNELILIGSVHVGYEVLNDALESMHRYVDSSCVAFADEATVDEVSKNELIDGSAVIPKTSEILCHDIIDAVFHIFSKKNRKVTLHFWC